MNFSLETTCDWPKKKQLGHDKIQLTEIDIYRIYFSFLFCFFFDVFLFAIHHMFLSSEPSRRPTRSKSILLRLSILENENKRHNVSFSTRLGGQTVKDRVGLFVSSVADLIGCSRVQNGGGFDATASAAAVAVRRGTTCRRQPFRSSVDW